MVQPLTPKLCPEECPIETQTGLSEPQPPERVTGIVCEQHGPGQHHGVADKEEREEQLGGGCLPEPEGGEEPLDQHPPVALEPESQASIEVDVGRGRWSSRGRSWRNGTT